MTDDVKDTNAPEADDDPKVDKDPSAMDEVSSPAATESIGGALSKFDNFTHKLSPARYQQLVTNEAVRAWSIYSLRYGIFADAMTGAILQPNYAILARPGAAPESFDDTKPFDPNSATYFIPMAGLLGVSVACLFTGKFSDKIGRKPVLQLCMGCSIFGNMLKWFLRDTFWGFCAATFANGLVSGGLPVALAYLGDVFPDYKTKQVEFGVIVGCFVLGNSFGGVIAILMESQGLFAPLWVAVAMMTAAFFFLTWYMIEPRDLMVMQNEETDSELDDDDSDIISPPETINKKVMWNIIIGAFADNVGSNGLFPICLAPLAFDQFYNNFAAVGEEPVLSLIGYKWMSVLV